MRRVNTITEFHPRAPKKLVRLYKQKGGNCYKVALERGVNPSHVWNLLKHGKEPRRLDLREKLFIRVPKSRIRQKVEQPPFLKQWYTLPKAERYKVIQQYITWRNKNEQSRKSETNSISS